MLAKNHLIAKILRGHKKCSARLQEFYQIFSNKTPQYSQPFLLLRGRQPNEGLKPALGCTA